MLSQKEYLLLMQYLPGVGAAAYWKMLEQFPTISTALEAPLNVLNQLLPAEACEILMEFREQGEQSSLVLRLREDQQWLSQQGVNVLDVHDDQYPPLLAEIKRAPPVLYVWGDPNILSLPQIAMVGSRNPTPGGIDNARAFSRELAESGLAITSGLALGVDIAAHQGALDAGGKTIAVLGTGVDHIYPRRHHSVACEIIEAGGAVISEFPLGAQPMPANFPQRNRIISGLSYGVIVVEAAVKSGSLITARYALQQNREVFAIPGSIHNPMTKGGHALIKEGAKLIETSKDVVEELRGFLALNWQASVEEEDSVGSEVVMTELVDNELEETILRHLDYDPTSFDVLLQRTKLVAGEVLATLLTMELKGLVSNMGSGYSLVRSACRTSDLPT